MDSLRPGAINQMSTEDLHRAPNREPTLSFKPLAEALVEFRKVLVDGGVEESHALMMTRDFLGILGQHPHLLDPPQYVPLNGWDYAKGGDDSAEAPVFCNCDENLVYCSCIAGPR